MLDGTPVLHDFGETTFRDYLDEDAGPVTNPKSESMLWNLIATIRESPASHYTYLQYRYQSLLLEAERVGAIDLKFGKQSKSNELKAASVARFEAAIAAEEYIDAEAAAAKAAAEEAKADVAAASSGKLTEAQARADAASKRAKAAAAVAAAHIATPPSAVRKYDEDVQKAYRKFNQKYEIYTNAMQGVVSDLRESTKIKLEARRRAKVSYTKAGQVQVYRNILELKKLGFLYDEEGKPVPPETSFENPDATFYLDPVNESYYYQLARIWDILSILAHLAKMDAPVPGVEADEVAMAAPPVAGLPPAADEADDAVMAAPPPPPPPPKTVGAAALIAIDALVKLWGKGEASKGNVRKTVDELRGALHIPVTDAAGELDAAKAYWIRATPARDSKGDAPAAAVGALKAVESTPGVSSMSHRLRYSISVLEDIRGEGILPLTDEVEEDDAPAPVPPADPVKQHALIKDLAPMVLGSYYRDHKGNPYTVIDEYIITDEDLPIFRGVMTQLEGGDATQVAFIRLRFYLLYADMLQLRYEHLLDELGGLPVDSTPGTEIDGYGWSKNARGQLLLTFENPDLEFKIKVLETDSFLLHDKLLKNDLFLDTWVGIQTSPDLVSELRRAGSTFDRLKPHQVLGICRLNIRRARDLIINRYKRAQPPPTPEDAAIKELITNASPEAVANAKKEDAEADAPGLNAEARVKAEAASVVALKELAAAVAPAKGGRRTSYRRGLSKLV
jgi:hypothetical protein